MGKSNTRRDSVLNCLQLASCVCTNVHIVCMNRKHLNHPNGGVHQCVGSQLWRLVTLAQQPLMGSPECVCIY